MTCDYYTIGEYVNIAGCYTTREYSKSADFYTIENNFTADRKKMPFTTHRI